MKLSCALAVYNEEENLATCLASVVGWVDEIVIVDGGSTDKTVEIAKKFNARIIHADNPPIFHINKQKALDASSCEWILQLDADEAVSEELKNEVLAIKQSGNHALNGYYLPRKNIMWGHWMRKGGQYPDYVIRLVRNGYARFPCRSVHEQIGIEGEIGYMKHPLLHYPYKTTDDYWRKADSYTTLTADEFGKKKESTGFDGFLKYCLIKPLITFFLLYFRHKGLLDGIAGFRFALYSALHWPIAFRKYRKASN